MRIGILTGGGDCPGLNATIRAIVRSSVEQGIEVRGFRDGWRGVVEDDSQELMLRDVRGIFSKGGTILGTSGVQPHRLDSGIERVAATLELHRLDGFLVVGGEGTLGASARLAGVPVIGIPKTIDNDIRGTDASIGFWTAAQIASELIDRLYSTAESHKRVMVCEVMGRTAGWIGLTAGMSAGADVILIPERPFNIRAIAERIRRVHAERRPFSIVVVSEGATPVEGTMEIPPYGLDENGWPRLGGIGAIVAERLQTLTGAETRVTTLGHVQRGGSPGAFDRVLASRLGAAAVEGVLAGRWGAMVGLRGTEIQDAPLGDVAMGPSVVPPHRWEIPEVLCS